LQGGRLLGDHQIGITERGQRARRDVAGQLRVPPNLSSHRLRWQAVYAHECPPHSFAIRKARLPRDGLDSMPAVFQHQPGDLETKFLDGFCRRLAGLGRKRACELAGAQMGLRRDVIERLPRLRFIASTGPRNISIDMAAASERGILVANTGYRSTPTIELTWALILASARHLVGESNSIRAGGWQTSIGHELDGRVLGVLGLGNVGGQVARIGRAFGMKIIAWSQNLTAEAAAAAGAELVTKDELFRRPDVVTIHLILSERNRGLVGAAELALMKPTARLVNTSRGPIVDEQALIEALRARAIAGAAVDVFDTEPLPEKHPFRSIENLLATPHIGFVAEDLYRTFYGDAAAAIGAWIEKQAPSP
jgi:phosphoglycerate dehydrogenase-like enzyme